MKPKSSALLVHPVFLVSLGLLLLNDFFLKHEFHNGFTGKLSDFAGLFAFAVFLVAFFPERKRLVLVLCGLFFIWWKSPLSEPFISAWNQSMPIAIDRAIDYSDLMALLVLPFVFFIGKKGNRIKMYAPRLLLNFVCLVSLFAFCFTSMPRYALYYTSDNKIDYYGTFQTSKTEKEVLQKMASLKIRFYKDSIGYYPLRAGEFYYRDKSASDSTMKWIPVHSMPDSVLYLKETESPFYIIPSYKMEGENLYNLKISFSHDGRKTYVSVRTDPATGYYVRSSGQLKRKFNRHFRELFK